MPTTPSWKSGSNTQTAGGGSSLSSTSASTICIACSRMPLSMSRRSRLMRVERARQFVGARRVVGQQALDAQRHVGQPAGGVDARPQREAEVEGGRHLRLARRHREQAGQSARQGAGADALEPLRHQAAVVGVELDHVGHRAQRHQRQQRVQLGLVGLIEHAALAQLGAQRQQHVEHHADTGDRLAFEAAAGLVGVDDDGGVGQLRARAGGGR